MSRYDRPSHRVFMVFFLRSGWSVQFLEQDCRTPLPRKFNFRDPEKIRELARRGEAMATQDARALKGIEGTDGVTPNVIYGGYFICPRNSPETLRKTFDGYSNN